MNELAALRGTLDYIEDRWRDAERSTLRPAFAELAAGRTASPSRLAEVTGTTGEHVRQGLVSGPVGLDGEGNISELFGVMLDPTIHRIEVGGRVVYACCALVAHCVPIILNEAARLESTDPVTRRLVRLTVSPEGVLEGGDRAWACFPTPPGERDLSSVRQAFCSHIQYFADAAAASEFASQDSRRRVVGSADLHELALATVSRIWSDA